MYIKILLAAAALTTFVSVRAAFGNPQLTTLLTFDSANGAYPNEALTMDAAGNLYGATGGGTDGGIVYELSGTNHQTETILATLGAGSDSGVVLDSAGNLYGTAFSGGTSDGGFVFEINGQTHSFSTLYNFNSSVTGSHPLGKLVLDAAGNLYGTNSEGGPSGYGSVFELSGTNHQTLSLLPAFTTSTGVVPSAGLTIDSQGNLYGTTTLYGGGNGTAIEFSGPNHQTLTVLKSFQIAPFYYVAPLVVDAAGDLFGTTAEGGAGGGMVYELSGPDHKTFTDIYNFTLNVGGPLAGLTIDAAGDIFGSTSSGGVDNSGTIFELSGPNYQTYTTLWSFSGSDGSEPISGLIADAQGNLYGETHTGGADNLGTVFELTGTGFVVPEPSSLWLLGISGFAVLRRKRR